MLAFISDSDYPCLPIAEITDRPNLDVIAWRNCINNFFKHCIPALGIVIFMVGDYFSNYRMAAAPSIDTFTLIERLLLNDIRQAGKCRANLNGRNA